MPLSTDAGFRMEGYDSGEPGSGPCESHTLSWADAHWTNVQNPHESVDDVACLDIYEDDIPVSMKIDASYLSPHVHTAARLEAATKIYSSNILMSGQFYDLLSDHIKVGIRLIDHITLKGGHKPLRVYADDRSNLWLKVNSRLIEIFGADDAYEQFSTVFHEGIDAFIKGDWATAWVSGEYCASPVSSHWTSSQVSLCTEPPIEFSPKFLGFVVPTSTKPLNGCDATYLSATPLIVMPTSAIAKGY